MPCSFCNIQGHNICTCQDPRISAGINSLTVRFVAPRVGRGFTAENISEMTNYLITEFPQPLLRAIGVQYCRLGQKALITHYVERIISKLAAELARVSQLSMPDIDEWSLSIMGMPWLEYVTQAYYEENTTVTWTEDYTPTVYHEEFPAFDIHISECPETVIECVICQEDKDSSQFVKTQCGHSFCNLCTTSHLLSKGLTRACCALCRSDITSLEASNGAVFEELSNQFSQTGALLKSCSLAVFGDSMWHWRTCKETIDMFLVEFADHKDLIKRVNETATEYEKAMQIWDYVRID